MTLRLIDWIIVAVSLVICFAPALFFGKRAGRSTSEFFASGRAVPWWLAGLSMVHDAATRRTRHRFAGTGVAGNCVVGACAHRHSTVFFSARLWRSAS
jgi:hypothetical protein